MTLGEFVYYIKTDDSGVQSGIGKAEKQMHSFGDRISKWTIAKGQVIGRYAERIISTTFSKATAVIKSAVSAYADYEQLVGGVDTLFKNSSKKVQAYAAQAYKTVGVSANQYMETVTSFSASLLQSLGNDTDKAADVANMAMVDMADNVNKMGSSMESVENAYRGFAKQNYTMLDNLKLGYGGTKSEMERLLKDAQKLTGQKYDIKNLSDVYEAIHAIQVEMGVAGTTQKEAETTITGSLNAAKAAWKDMLTSLGTGKDVQGATKRFTDSIKKVAQNLVPVVKEVFKNLVVSLKDIVPQFTLLIGDVWQELRKQFPEDSFIGKAMDAIQGLMQLLGDLVIDWDGTIEKLKSSDSPVLQKLGWALSLVGTVAAWVWKALNDLPGAISELQNSDSPILQAVGNALDLVRQAIEWIINNQDKAVIAAEAIIGVFLISKVGAGIYTIISFVDKIKSLGNGSKEASAIKKILDAGGQNTGNTPTNAPKNVPKNTPTNSPTNVTPTVTAAAPAVTSAATGAKSTLFASVPGLSSVFGEAGLGGAVGGAGTLSLLGALGGTTIIAGLTWAAGEVVKGLNAAAAKEREVETDIHRFDDFLTNEEKRTPNELANVSGTSKDKREIIQEAVRELLGTASGSAHSMTTLNWLGANINKDMVDLFNYTNTSGESKNKLIDMLMMNGNQHPAVAAKLLSYSGIQYNDILKKYGGAYAKAYSEGLQNYSEHGAEWSKTGGFTESMDILKNFFLNSGATDANGDWTIPALLKPEDGAQEKLQSELNQMSLTVPVTPSVNGEGEKGFGQAKGDWFVPYDNYPSLLHRGEMVLSASQARKYRDGGGDVDYAVIGEMIGSAVKGAMSKVYVMMSGEKVGDLTTRRVNRNINASSYSRLRAMGG